MSEQREVTENQILQLTVRFTEILGSTCLNRKRGQSTPESVNCDPVLTAPLGCAVPQSFTLVVNLTVLTSSEVFRPAVAQQYGVVYHDPGHHMTQQVELANVR